MVLRGLKKENSDALSVYIDQYKKVSEFLGISKPKTPEYIYILAILRYVFRLNKLQINDHFREGTQLVLATTGYIIYQGRCGYIYCDEGRGQEISLSTGTEVMCLVPDFFT